MAESRFEPVTREEAELEIAKALLPFLIEEGTPVNIRRNGWVLIVSTSIAGHPQGRTEQFIEEDWSRLTGAVATFCHVTGLSFYTTAMVIPELGTWWVIIEQSL